MSIFGINVSRSGYNVLTASDQEMLFESEFPSLKIQARGSTAITNNTGPFLLYSYPADMAYVPVFWGFVVSGGQSQVLGSGYSQYLLSTSASLYWNPTSISTGLPNFTLYWYVFRSPLSTTITAKSLRGTVGTAKTGSAKFGIRASAPGKSATKSADYTDKRNMTFDSTTRSPIVHMSGLVTYTLGTPLVLTHNLGYSPLYFAFFQLSGSGYWQSVFSADDANVSATATQITIAVGYSGKAAYVIFKDPLLVSGE